MVTSFAVCDRQSANVEGFKVEAELLNAVWTWRQTFPNHIEVKANFVCVKADGTSESFYLR